MAKKDTKSFDDWDDFEDFSIFDEGAGEGGFKSTTKKGKAREAVSALTGGFVSGVKKSLFTRGFYQSAVGEALPKEYSIALDKSLEMKDNVADLYDDAYSEAGKINDKLTKGVKPIVDKYGDRLPKRMARPMKKWTQNVRATNTWTKENKDELESVAAINDIFNKREQTRSASKTSIEATVQTGIAKTSMDLTARLLGQQQQLVAYQDQIDAVWKRKTLELQYKQFFVQRKSLDSQQQLLAISQAAYTEIVKNTALPDFAKANKSEIGGRIMTDKLYGAAIDRFSAIPQNIAQKLTRNVSKKMKSSSRDVQQSLMDGLSTIYDHLDDADAMGEQLGQVGSLRQSGELGGDMASGTIAKFLGKKIKKRYGDNEKVKHGADVLNNNSRRLPRLFNDLVKSGDTGSNFLDMMLEFMDAREVMGTGSSRVMASHVDELDKGAHFDLLTKKSITEIIPGFLTRIHHEIRSLRTGDDTTPMLAYDHEKSRFSDLGKLNKRAKDKILGSYNKQALADSENKFAEALGLNGKLSDNVRAEVINQFSLAALTNSDFTVRSLFDEGKNNLTPEEKEELALFLMDEFDMDVNEDGVDPNASFISRVKDGINNQKRDPRKAQALQRKIGDAADELQSRLPNPSGQLARLAARGDIEQALSLGIITETNGVYTVSNQDYLAKLREGNPGDTDSSGDFDPTIDPNEKEKTAADRLAADVTAKAKGWFGRTKNNEKVQRVTNKVNETVAEQKARLAQTSGAAHARGAANVISSKTKSATASAKILGADAVAAGQLAYEDPEGAKQEAMRQADAIFTEAKLQTLIAIEEAHKRIDPMATKAKGKYSQTKTELENLTREDIAAKVNNSKATSKAKYQSTKDAIKNTTREDINNRFNDGKSAARTATNNKINNFKTSFTGEKLDELKGKYAQNDKINKAIEYVKVKTGKKDPSVGDITSVYAGDADFRELVDVIEEETNIGKLRGKLKSTTNNISQSSTVVAALKRIEESLPTNPAYGEDARRPDESNSQYAKRMAKKTASDAGAKLSGVKTKVSAFSAKIKGSGEVTTEDHDAAEDYAEGFISDNGIEDKDGSVKESLMRTFFKEHFGDSALLDKIRRTGELAGGAKARGKRGIDTMRSKKMNSNVGDAVSLLFQLGKYGAKAGEVLTRPHRAALSMIPWGVKKLINLVVDTKNFQHIQHALWIPGEKEPRLLKAGLMNGRYINGKGKTIVVPKDIEGDIYDAMSTPADLIMTQSDYKQGLYDSTGKLIHQPPSLMKKITNGIIAMPFKLAKTAVKLTGKFMMGYLKITTKPATWMIKKIMSEKSIDPKLHAELVHLGLTDQTNAKLDNIGKLMDERLPGGKKKHNDKDGDGDRDGGFADTKERKAAEKKAAKEKKEGFLSRFFKKKKKDKDGDDEESDGMDLMGMLGKGKMFGRIAGLAKNPWVLGGVAIASLLGWEGLTDNSKNDNPDDIANQVLPDAMKDSKAARIGVRMTEKLIDGLLIGPKMAAKGYFGANKLGQEAGGWVRRKIQRGGESLVNLTGKIWLGGVQKLYGTGGRRWVEKLMNMDNWNPLYRFRMAQYGFAYNDQNGAEAVLKLEDDILNSLIPATDTAPARISSNITVEQSASYFGVSVNDEKDMREWVTWYANRFRPVFLSNVTILQRMGFDGKKLHEIDSTLGKSEKLSFANKVNFFREANNPYDVEHSPMSSEWSVDIAGSDAVEEIRQIQIAEIEKMSESKKDLAEQQARTAKFEGKKKDKAMRNYEGVKPKDKVDINARIDSINTKNMLGATKQLNTINETNKAKETTGNGGKFGGAGAGATASANTIEEKGYIGAALSSIASSLGGMFVTKAHASAFMPEMQYGGATTPMGKGNNNMLNAGLAAAAGTSAFKPNGPDGTSAMGPNDKPMIAARLARKAARENPGGTATKFIKNALSKAGYTFSAPASASEYPAKALPDMGFVKIENKTPWTVGDIMVFSSNKTYPNGHIQIYDGANWISDHVQPGWSPFVNNAPSYTIWRDMQFATAGSFAPKKTKSNPVAVAADGAPIKVDSRGRAIDTNSSANEKVDNKGALSKVWDSIKEKTTSTWDATKAWMGGRSIQNKINAGFAGVSNFLASMTGSQKEWQMCVYKAFKAAAFSEQQSRILTAEIGRENSYNPKYLFAGHADPHKGSNLGMLSWQGTRKPKLVSFLKSFKVLDRSNNMVPGQEALNAQAQFIMWEMKNTHKGVGAEFLSQPNIDYAKGAYMIGKRYILWRIDDPAYSSKGIKNRDGFYNMLLKQLEGGAGANTTPAKVKANASPATAAATQTAPGSASKPQPLMMNMTNAMISKSQGSSNKADYSGVLRDDKATVSNGGNGTATPWMDIARSQLGINENGNAATVNQYHAVGAKQPNWSGTKYAWCASFVGWVLNKAGLKHPITARALDYASYGKKLSKDNIPYGAIMVMKIGKGNHVCFCAEDKGANVVMLGGNQSSKKKGDQRNGGEVTLSTISKKNVVQVVYPHEYIPGASAGGAYSNTSVPTPYNPVTMLYKTDDELDAKRKAAIAKKTDVVKHDSGYTATATKAIATAGPVVKSDGAAKPQSSKELLEGHRKVDKVTKTNNSELVPLKDTTRVPAAVPVQTGVKETRVPAAVPIQAGTKETRVPVPVPVDATAEEIKQVKVQQEVNKTMTQKMAEAEARKSNDDLASSSQTLKESLKVQRQMLEKLSSVDAHLEALNRGMKTREITESSSAGSNAPASVSQAAKAKNNPQQHQVRRPGRDAPMSMSKLG